ncbi:MAG TPA: acylphosphatase [Acidimicrobiia bacterium]|nr:acylphosphatase [Acidimicrobiia bacterium]
MPGLTPGSPAEPERVRARVFVTGRVQGVWFRESCREQAVALGVGGWVRNRSDGRVEAVFEGPPAAVDRLVAWCAEGPSRARVDSVEERREAPTGEPGFHVR